MAPFVSGQVCSIPTLDSSLGIDALKDHLSEGINIQFEYMYFEHVISATHPVALVSLTSTLGMLLWPRPRGRRL